MSRPTPSFPDVCVHQACPQDVDAVVRLVNSAYRGEEAKQGWTTEADLLGGQRVDASRIQEIMRDPQQSLLLWSKPETRELVACVLLEQRGPKAYLGMLTVHPTLQNAGLGRQILDYSERWVANQWAIFCLEMTVISVRDELIRWYERRGYYRTGERRPFQMNDPRFGLPKVSFLEFVVLEKKWGQ